MATEAVVAGCYGDEKEVTWLRECWSKSCEELEISDLAGQTDRLRWKKVRFFVVKGITRHNTIKWGITIRGCYLEGKILHSEEQDSLRKANSMGDDRLL